jgi:hypothetical protein
MLLEFVVFRFFLVASDVPDVDFVNGIVKYAPDQKGVYRIRNEIAAKYRINKNGWNSGHDRYKQRNLKGRYRIAIIGDSYVEALQVDYDKSLAEDLEEMLGQDKYEVYRFGISGAPMSQYMHMLRNEVLQYSPDAVFVILVHNDFNESYELIRGTYASNFLKLNISDGHISETPPLRLLIPWYNFIRRSATWRYLAVRQKMPYHRLKDILLGNKANYYQANIEISKLKYVTKNKRATEYVFKNLKRICANNGIRLWIVMNGVMEVIYNNAEEKESRIKGALSLNAIANETAQKLDINYIDLQEVFRSDYATHHKKFTYENDGHWNEYGHKVVAQILSSYILQRKIKGNNRGDD